MPLSASGKDVRVPLPHVPWYLRSRRYGDDEGFRVVYQFTRRMRSMLQTRIWCNSKSVENGHYSSFIGGHAILGRRSSNFILVCPLLFGRGLKLSSRRFRWWHRRTQEQRCSPMSREGTRIGRGRTRYTPRIEPCDSLRSRRWQGEQRKTGPRTATRLSTRRRTKRVQHG